MRVTRPISCGAVAGALTLAASILVAAPAPARAQAGATRLTIVEGEARFRAREVFLGQVSSNEAVGRTPEVSGSAVLLPDGSFAGGSAITVDLRNLRSDQALRDNYIKNNTLAVRTYPTVRFVPSGTEGLPLPPPAVGPVSFRLLGEMTVRDQTRAVAWDVTAELAETAATGTAITGITFEQFGLSKPEIEDIASIEDVVKVELDFRAAREVTQ